MCETHELKNYRNARRLPLLRRRRESQDPMAFVQKTLDSRFRGNDDITGAGVTHVRNAQYSRHLRESGDPFCTRSGRRVPDVPGADTSARADDAAEAD